MKRLEILTEELKKSMRIFMKKDSFIEVRILNTQKGTISGYFDNVENMLSAVKQYDGKYNIFFSMNEPVKGVESRSVNRLKEYSRNTTTDSEIAVRRWILIDLDPVRPSGISSTDDELKQSEMLSTIIKECLSNAGFPEPVTALSGNGYHLLYPIAMPNDKGSIQIIKSFLKYLDVTFSTETVKVDIANYNASRITKLYGTIACKGDNTQERPHRRSRIISVPDEIIETPINLIEGLVLKERCEKKEMQIKNKYKTDHKENKKENEVFFLEKWLDKHKIMVAKKKETEGGMCYVLEECPWNQEHSRDKGAYVIQFDNGAIVAGCHHDCCKKNGVNWKSLWNMKEGNAIQPNVLSVETKEKQEDDQKKSQADTLLEILEELGHEYFRNEKGDTFVHIQNGENSVNYSLDSELYHLLITKTYYEKTKKSIKKETVKQVVDTLSAKALFEGTVYETYKRYGVHKGKLYYFLADEKNSVLCISEAGIEECKVSPIRLIKRKTMLAQPMPLEGKDLADMMKKYYCFASEEDEMLHAVILVARLITSIEQPIVIYSGPKGSYKTTSMDMDKRILDYTSANITKLPKNEEDFLLTLDSQDVLCFDNIDNISKTQADIFCQVVSGAVFLKRKKYTDAELCEISLKSTIYMTGINLLSGRTDFLSRCIFINTKGSDSKNKTRKSKLHLMEEFERDKPYILYDIFIIFSKAINIYKADEEIELDDRLLDFLKWGFAIAKAMGYSGDQFLKAYKKKRLGIDEEALANDEVANAVMLYLERYGSFSGSMTQLSKELTEIVLEESYAVSNKIKCAIPLSTRLGELETSLNAIGIQVEIGKKSGKRYVNLSKSLAGQEKTIKRGEKKKR
jgi:hypothetical protein